MAARSDVRITLLSQRKACPNGHRVGDTWLVRGQTPAGMCLSAFHALSPFLMTLRYGGEFPWEPRPGEVTVCCPDAEVVNVFRLERVDSGEPARGGGSG